MGRSALSMAVFFILAGRARAAAALLLRVIEDVVLRPFDPLNWIVLGRCGTEANTKERSTMRSGSMLVELTQMEIRIRGHLDFSLA